MKHKILGIFLFLCFIAPIGGSGIWLSYKRRAVRREVKNLIIAGLDKNELSFLKFSFAEQNSNLKWKHKKEFEYNGQMYDIVERSYSKDSVSYWCWLDKKETKLNRQLNRLLTFNLEHNPIHKDQHSQIEVQFKSLFFNQIKTRAELSDVSNSITPCYTFNTNTAFLDTASPPPQIV